MIKSWLNSFLPSDEYKKQKNLYFLSESLIIIIFFLFISLLLNNLLNITLDFELVVMLAFAICSIYYFLRYVLSGIEYSNIYTKKEFKIEKRKIVFQTIRFTIMFGVLYLLFVEVPKSLATWLEYAIYICIIGIFAFLMSYISLRRSYNKNKKLVD